MRLDLMIAPGSVRMLQDSDLPRALSPIPPDFNDVMYMYRQCRSLDGIPVSLQAQNLLVSSLLELRNALRLQAHVYTFLLWLTPDSQDKLRQYLLILQAAVLGSALIILLTKQYSLSKGAFLVFVKYRCVLYTLHPRWLHLKDNNEV